MLKSDEITTLISFCYITSTKDVLLPLTFVCVRKNYQDNILETQWEDGEWTVIVGADPVISIHLSGDIE